MYYHHGNSCSKGQTHILYDSSQHWGSIRRVVLELSLLCLPEDKQKPLNFPLRSPLNIKLKKNQDIKKGHMSFCVLRTPILRRAVFKPTQGMLLLYTEHTFLYLLW